MHSARFLRAATRLSAVPRRRAALPDSGLRAAGRRCYASTEPHPQPATAATAARGQARPKEVRLTAES